MFIHSISFEEFQLNNVENKCIDCDYVVYGHQGVLNNKELISLNLCTGSIIKICSVYKSS